MHMRSCEHLLVCSGAQEAEYLERCWLLLADIYVASNKADLATDLLKRTISHNKARTCTRTQHSSRSHFAQLKHSGFDLCPQMICSSFHYLCYLLVLLCTVQSCYKAYEYMALICERAQDFGEAVRYYEFAWRLVNQNDPAIGYKLAFNYIKVRRFFEAIDVGQKVCLLHALDLLYSTFSHPQCSLPKTCFLNADTTRAT